MPLTGFFDKEEMQSMNSAIQRKPEHSFLDTLKNCVALFASLSSALLIAFFAVRMMEIISISKTTQSSGGYPDCNRTGAPVRYRVLSENASVPVRSLSYRLLHHKNEEVPYLAYGVGGSIVLILYAVLIKYFATAGVPLGADLFGYSVKEIEETVSGGLTIDAISIFLFVIPVAVFWASLAFLYSRKSIKPAYAFVILGRGRAGFDGIRTPRESIICIGIIL